MLMIGFPRNYIAKPPIWSIQLQPDKIFHFLLFAPFSFLWAKYLWLATNKKYFSLGIALLFGLIYAILTELFQFYFFVGRNANINDVIADSLGVLLGLFLVSRLQTKLKN